MSTERTIILLLFISLILSMVLFLNTQGVVKGVFYQHYINSERNSE